MAVFTGDGQTHLVRCTDLGRGQRTRHGKRLHDGKIFHHDKLVRSRTGRDGVQNQFHITVLSCGDGTIARIEPLTTGRQIRADMLAHAQRGQSRFFFPDVRKVCSLQRPIIDVTTDTACARCRRVGVNNER